MVSELPPFREDLAGACERCGRLNTSGPGIQVQYCGNCEKAHACAWALIITIAKAALLAYSALHVLHGGSI